MEKQLSYNKLELFGMSLKSLGKLLLLSKKERITPRNQEERPLIIMGNGPSLKEVIRDNMDLLKSSDTLAVNFAANSAEFTSIRPRYYVLADPRFFHDQNSHVVAQLIRNISRVSWPMELFVPLKELDKSRRLFDGKNITVTGYNDVGIHGWEWLERMAYNCGRGMPRPRNVLIPSIMIGIRLGYKDIYLVGADHSWSRDLAVDNDNHIVNFQPHFYKDEESEVRRRDALYRDIPVHEVFGNFMIAFRSYFHILRWAERKGVNIYNATPGSLIDAFKRKHLPALKKD